MANRKNLWLVNLLLLSAVAGGLLSPPAIAQSSLNDEIAPAGPETLTEPSYILGSGDQIDITVFDYTEFTGPKVILPDGTITLPMVGSVRAAGLTTEQLTQELVNRLEPLLINPVVTVTLSVLRPVTVNVAGEVQRPGPLQLRGLTATDLTVAGNSVEGAPTLSTALIEAGGITQSADIRRITLNRRTTEGATQLITVNLWDAIGSDNATIDFMLQDGDSIYVPRLAANDNATDRRLVARSRFAPETVRVRVVGEVGRPGEVQVPPDSSISSAVAIAGGPTNDARLSRVAFIRMDETGEIKRETIDLRNLTDNYQVQEGDVIIVPERSDTSLLDFAGRVFSPLGALLNLINGTNNLFGGD